jgi:hypothetical protein
MIMGMCMAIGGIVVFRMRWVSTATFVAGMTVDYVHGSETPIFNLDQVPKYHPRGNLSQTLHFARSALAVKPPVLQSRQQ